jgi:hypothetical protein
MLGSHHMTTSSKKMIKALNKKIDGRKLVWFGTRGTDSRALLELDGFKELFSIIAPLNSLAIDVEVCLETEINRRVDLDDYRIDDDDSEAAKYIHRRLYDSLVERACLASYRPSNFLTSIYFPRSSNVEYLGLFHEIQNIFEHKPWVETELRKQGINTIPWSYIGDEDRQVVLERLESGPQVIRTSRSDGGAGLALIEDPSQLEELWVPHRDYFMGVAPYYKENIPLNVNAVVFPDGTVTLHPPSLQLIGIKNCTKRRFGYCGNDFARIGEISPKFLNELEGFIIQAGKWMASKGYLGAFGVDALLADGQVLITEINPRFQGSSDVTSWIDLDMGRPDMFLDHIAAFLGVDPHADKIRLRDLAREQMKVSQIICHNTAGTDLYRNSQHESSVKDVDKLELLSNQDVLMSPESILFRAVLYNSVTEMGGNLKSPYNEAIEQAIISLFNKV